MATNPKPKVFSQQTLQAIVLERFMTESECRKFEKTYKANRIKDYKTRTRIPTAEDVRLYKEFKAGATISNLARKYGKSYTAVKTCLLIGSLVD